MPDSVISRSSGSSAIPGLGRTVALRRHLERALLHHFLELGA